MCSGFTVLGSGFRVPGFNEKLHSGNPERGTLNLEPLCVQGSPFWVPGLGVPGSGFKSLKKDERRTSNIERPTSNKCILSIFKNTEQSESALRNLSAFEGSCGSLVLK